MEQVIPFNKSLQERLQEFRDVLCGYEVLPVSAIAREWGFYLELAMDPSGWQAVWKIPRLTCEQLKIPFPTVVLVFVISTDLRDLSALVQVFAVQDDISIPKKHTVPLIQLWPTTEQDESIALRIHNTANALDNLRFFYTNVFMPWDREDNDSTDWLSKHLESRLRLYYDVKNGVIPRPIAERLHSLLSEARRIQARTELIESELEDSDIDVGRDTEDTKVQELMELHLRMSKIKCEVKALENPLLRTAVIRQQKKFDTKKQPDLVKQVWVIQNEGRKIEDMIEFFNVVKNHFPEAPVKCSSDLAMTLETSSPNDIYVLNKDIHTIKTVGALEEGGILKGVGASCETMLTSEIEDVMMDFQGDSVLLENLSIIVSSARCGIVVRRGKLTISNCKIFGDNGTTSTQQGIIVLAGGELELIDSEMCGFTMAVVGNSGSKIKLRNTNIHNVTFGMKIFHNCTVMAERSIFRDCKNYGICVEMDNCEDADDQTGDFSLLSIIPNIRTECVKGENNAKGDVAINQRKIRATLDVFSDPGLNATLSGCDATSDQDMDITETTEMNATVIHNVQTKRPLSPATI